MRWLSSRLLRHLIRAVMMETSSAFETSLNFYQSLCVFTYCWWFGYKFDFMFDGVPFVLSTFSANRACDAACWLDVRIKSGCSSVARSRRAFICAPEGHIIFSSCWWGCGQVRENLTDLPTATKRSTFSFISQQFKGSEIGVVFIP
jgi:hypothetical protein